MHRPGFDHWPGRWISWLTEGGEAPREAREAAALGREAQLKMGQHLVGERGSQELPQDFYW